MNPVLVAMAAALFVGVMPAAAAEPTPEADPTSTSSPSQWSQPTSSVAADPQDIVAESGESGRMTVVYAVQAGDTLSIRSETVPSARSAVDTIAEIQTDPDVLAVDVDSTHHLTELPRALAASSNDPSRSQQWALDTLHAENAWASTNGAGVVVAVIDSGISRHPDLAGAFVPGIDVVDGTDPRVDDNGHGTHVAGIIAMTANNNVGGAGLAPGVALMPVVVADADGSVRASDSARGIVWAVDHGANVINMSYSGSATSVEQKAIQYAQSRGVVAVAAVGNEYLSQGSVYNPVQYPAAFPGVIGVGAISRGLKRSSFSEVGKQVDVVAPGGSGAFDSPQGIFSTFRRSDYASMQGTSMASPYVAAAMALTIARERVVGISASPVDIVLGTSTDLGVPGRDNEYGFGLVDPVAALSLVNAIASSGASAPTVRTSEVSTRPVHKITVEVNPGYIRYRIPAKGRFVVAWQEARRKGWSSTRALAGTKKGRAWYRADTAGGLEIRLVAYRKGKAAKNDPVWISGVFRTRATQPGTS